MLAARRLGEPAQRAPEVVPDPGPRVRERRDVDDDAHGGTLDPTLSARDALRRYLPLPRPVPESFPARIAREVPRLGARARVDARSIRSCSCSSTWLIFSVIVRAVIVDHYPLFLLTGLLVWVFFQSTIQMSCTSLLGQASLVKQVRLPRQLLPFRSSRRTRDDARHARCDPPAQPAARTRNAHDVLGRAAALLAAHRARRRRSRSCSHRRRSCSGTSSI